MPTVTKTTRTVTKTVEVDEDVFTLVLSRDEAELIYDLVGIIGGDGPRRPIVNDLYNTLEKAGALMPDEEKGFNYKRYRAADIEGTLRMKNTKR